MAEDVNDKPADETTPDEPTVVDADGAAGADQPGRQKIGFGIATILVVATLITLLAFISIWANRQLLNTDQWTETSSALLEKPAVQDALANYLVDELFNNIDVEQELSDSLPPSLSGLAGPISGGLRQLALRGAETALEKPAVQNAWKDANRISHKQLIQILNGGSAEISTANGVVTINTRVLLRNVARQVGVPESLVDKLPPEIGQLEVMQSDDLETAQKASKAIKGMAWIFTILALALYILAIWLGAGRRRRVVRWVGISFASVGLLLLLIDGFGRDPIVNSLATTSSLIPAVNDVYSVSTELLHEMAVSTFVSGLLILLGSMLAGPTRFAVGFRRAIAPFLKYYLPACAAFAALLFLLVVWWAPTSGFRTAAGLSLNLLLAVSGFVALTMLTRKEFPDAEQPDFSTADDWVKERWQGVEDFYDKHTERFHDDEPTVESKPAAKADDKLAEIERLQSLRERGALTDEEFAEQKRKLLGSDS